MKQNIILQALYLEGMFKKLLNESDEIVFGTIKKEFSNRQASELEVR